MHASGHPRNKQAAARAVRYNFLARVARAQGANAVAAAHHADDQAETVLLHLLRGAGPAGLRGMRSDVPWEEWSTPEQGMPPSLPRGPLLIRPLLGTTRGEIEHYCTEQQLTPQHDPSNQEPVYTRNRVRADLLPHLARYNQHIVTALGRTAHICADDYAYMQQQLDAAWSAELVEEQNNALRFSLAHWHALHPSLQRYALRRAALLLAGRDDLGYEQVETGRAATCKPTGHQRPLGYGLVVQVEYESFLVARSTPEGTPAPVTTNTTALPQLATASVPLLVPGMALLAPGWRAEASTRRPAVLPAEERWRWWAVLDASSLDDEPLVFRRRQAGDRFRPVGGVGSRSLQDFFVDQKVPRGLRDAWPLLATPRHIVWVGGLRADARFAASEQTTRTVWVTLHRTA
jgi:tRNA(Ile)-lysidine synthetase-like protein